MRNQIALMTSLILCVLFGTARAAEVDLNRDEVTSIKKKLTAARDILATPPGDYAQEREDFNLPTTASTNEKGLFWPIYSGVSLNFGSKSKA
jgi:hypothetical protein